VQDPVLSRGEVGGAGRALEELLSDPLGGVNGSSSPGEVGTFRAADHQDGEAEVGGRDELGGGQGATGVPGDEDVD
jgi:hypothetical protein